MNFIKFFLMTMLFVVTDTSVMATDPYDAFGGRAVKASALQGRLSVVEGEGGFILTFKAPLISSFGKVDGTGFTGGNVIKNLFGFAKEIYAKAGAVAGDKNFRGWLASHSGSAKTAKLTSSKEFKKTTVEALLAENAAAIAEFVENPIRQYVIKTQLDTIEDEDTTVAALKELHEKGFDLIPTVGDYSSLGTAYTAYTEALAKARAPETAAEGLAEVTEALARAAALRIEEYDLSYTFEDFLRPVSRPSYEAMKQREKAKPVRVAAAGPAAMDEQRFGEILLQKLIEAAGNSELSGLLGTSVVKAAGLTEENFDVSTLLSSEGAAIQALIKGMMEMNDALSSKTLQEHQLAKEKEELMAAIAKS
jgi:hypothetical protein